MSATRDEPQRPLDGAQEPGELALRATRPAVADVRDEATRRELSFRATQAASPNVARDLSFRETLHTGDAGPTGPLSSRETEVGSSLAGTLETLAPGAAPRHRPRPRPPLPGPDIDGIAADQIKSAIMSELFGGPASAVKIGRFTVLERLGEGGMGVVYAAYDAQLDRKIAVKLLRPDTVGDDAGARTRLLREAQAMARVSHGNLITVHEVGEHQGAVYVAMEFVKGQSLDVWLAGRPGWREILEVFGRAGKGLAAAHAAGIVHRDFKPHNVMRGDDGAVKVLDFGLARATGAAALTEGEASPAALLDARMTRTGAVMGTPAYMSPEQHEGEIADARSDQFSFCVALHEGLFGQLPFAGETMIELVGNVMAARMVPPPEGTVPRWVTRIVTRGLALRAEDRFPTMEALLAALARDPTRVRRRWLAGAGLSTLLVGGGFGLASMAQETGPAPCTGAAAEIAEVWGEARRTATRAGLVAAVPELGARTWEVIAPRLDGHAEGWAAMRTEACEAHQAGRQSDRLLDLRMACLDRRRAGLDALTTAFAAADPDAVINAVAAVEGLGEIAACGDVERLTATVPPPEDATRARAVREQQLALERVAAEQLTGHYAAAMAGAEAVSAAASSLDYAPLSAEAALARGRAHQELREAEPADVALTAALAAALRGRVDAIAAEAAARQIFVRGELLGAPALGLAGVAAADALIDRAGDPPLIRWLWALNVALVRFNAGDLELAREHFERAGEVARAAGLEQAAAITVFNEGWLAVRAGDLEVAAARFGAGMSAIDAALGATHPIAWQMRMMLAQARWELGQTVLVRDMLEEVLPRLLAVFGPEAADVQSAQVLAAEVELAYRRFDSAHAYGSAARSHAVLAGPAADAERIVGLALVGLGRIDEGLAHVRAAVDKSGEELMLGHINMSYLGDAQLAAGRLDAALASHTEALSGFIAATGGDSTYTAIVRSHLARTLLARGELVEAHTAIVAARDAFAAHQPRSPYLAGIWRTLGEIERARGRASEAEAALREADRRFAVSFDDDHPDRNATRFLLAQALETRAPAEAVALARQAGAVYAGLGEGFAVEAAAITTWLSRQPG